MNEIPRGEKHASQPRSLSNLRLIPVNIHRDRDDKIRPACERLAFLILFVLGRGDHPYIAVVVAAEFAFRIGSIQGRREKAGRAKSSDEIFIVVAIYGQIFFHRPYDIDGTKLDIISGVRLVVSAALVSDRIELLETFGVN